MKSKSISRDRKLVSSQKYEIDYTAKKVAGKTGSNAKAKSAVLKAKKALGRNTSRKAVVARARKGA
jgi:hypothetical protein